MKEGKFHQYQYSSSLNFPLATRAFLLKDFLSVLRGDQSENKLISSHCSGWRKQLPGGLDWIWGDRYINTKNYCLVFNILADNQIINLLRKSNSGNLCSDREPVRDEMVNRIDGLDNKKYQTSNNILSENSPSMSCIF